MNLKFVCSEKFELAGEICNRMQGYLPNLIGKIEIVRNDAFKGIFDFQDILPMVESKRIGVRPTQLTNRLNFSRRGPEDGMPDYSMDGW